MNHHNLCAIGATLLALSITCHAQVQDYGQGQENLAPPLLLANSQGQNDHWKGIGRLQLNPQYPHAYCTASLIDSRGDATLASGPAYVLTAGHCISFNSLNVIKHPASDGHIDFNYFHDTVQGQKRYTLKQVNWSSLRGLDMAIIELDASLQTLIDAGIEPLKLSDAVPATGHELLIVGAPTTYPENALRLSTCRHVSTENLVEHPAIFRSFYKNHCQGLKPGSSGSPLLDRSSNTILGVVSTSTEGSLEENRCFENAPCELKNGQPHWAPGSNYSSPTNFLPKCFINGQFEPDASGCDLLPSATMSPKGPQVIRYYRRAKQGADGQPVLPTWKTQFGLDTPFYRYKAVRDPLLCTNPDFYSQALPIESAFIDEPIGPETGMHLLCIIGVDTQEQRPTWPMMKYPLIMAVELAIPGPTRAPKIDIRKQADGGYSVALHFSSPTLSAYEYKVGTPSETCCEEAQGYARTFEDLQFSASQLPLRLCTKAIDMTGQRSVPQEDLMRP
jgi:hypothetical protein